ncbi:MAG: T9SS type A sorting domain-containing protein [Bradyrhizobiaceae bacterium]|nr:T9SS type A sorting domain-containing protein [Bradyrhizobiaceae bacterium]
MITRIASVLALIALLCSSSILHAAEPLRILFIGNSYTAVNNLPDMVGQLAAQGGHAVTVMASAPGGMTLQAQSTFPPTVDLIKQGNWDYVVLQEQSQLPSFPDEQVEQQFYPNVKKLDALIHEYSPCAQVILYVTWGRKNGDQQNGAFFPPVATYEGMDSLLTLRYSNAADTIGALLSPVGPLWHAIRDSFPNVEMYQPDESHPTLSGTYAAACSFYALLFGESVESLNVGVDVSPEVALAFQQLARIIVADKQAYWSRFVKHVDASFTIDSSRTAQTYVGFTNTSVHADHYLWDFGDGTTDTSQSPLHEFAAGTHTVCLTAYRHCDSVTMCDTIEVTTTSVHEDTASRAMLYPNPASTVLTIADIEAAQYVVIDLAGGEVLRGVCPSPASTIDVSTLASGMYYVVVTTSTSRSVHPLVIVAE